MLEDIEINEAFTGVPVGEIPQTGRKWKVRLIEGDRLGSSGYYPADTLLRDGPKLFVKGTPMYLDHQTAEERENRPFGSVSTYAGELSENAYYDGDGLYAEVEVWEHHIPMIKALKDKIGISIRAKARTEPGIINGRRVPIVKEIVLARSADFVVKAGAGGKLIDILESAVDESTDSENLEGTDNVEELLEALTNGLKTIQDSVDTRLTAIEESLKPVEEEKKTEDEVVESAVDVESTKALAKSGLSDASIDRVVELHAATKKPLAELIESEKAYLKVNAADVEEAGRVIDDGGDAEVQESAIKLPAAWNKRK